MFFSFKQILTPRSLERQQQEVLERFKRRNNPDDDDEMNVSAGYRPSSNGSIFRSNKKDARNVNNDSKDHQETFEDIVPIVDEFGAQNDGNSDDFMQFEAVDADD